MARLNAKRRRELAARRALTEFAKVVNPTSQADKGHVRSSHKIHVLDQMIPAVAKAYTPKPLHWEGNGKAKPKLHQKPKAKVQGTSYDSLRAHYARSWANGRPKQPKD